MLGCQGITLFSWGFFVPFFLDIKWVQQKMKEQHEKDLQELEVSSLVLICSVPLSTDVCVCIRFSYLLMCINL